MNIRNAFLGLSFMLCCAMPLSAEETTHNFKDMITASTLTLTNSNKTGATDLFTYCCSGTAVFGLDLVNSTSYKVAALNMSTATSVVVSDKAIEGLTNIRISHLPTNATRTNLHIWISTDGAAWTDVSASAVYNKGQIDISLDRGDYYIKLTSTSSSSLSINEMKYTWETCNCFPFSAE